VTPTLTSTRPFDFPYRGDPPLARLRATEAAMTGVQETWKLYGAGSAGGQALVGIPRVRELRDDPELTPFSRVWPFETGFTDSPAAATGPCVVHAEIWPGIVLPAAVAAETAATDPPGIRDEVQVRLMCRWARDRDADGTLGAHLLVDGLAGGVRDAARHEEGWILGCPAPGRDRPARPRRDPGPRCGAAAQGARGTPRPAPRPSRRRGGRTKGGG